MRLQNIGSEGPPLNVHFYDMNAAGHDQPVISLDKVSPKNRIPKNNHKKICFFFSSLSFRILLIYFADSQLASTRTRNNRSSTKTSLLLYFSLDFLLVCTRISVFFCCSTFRKDQTPKKYIKYKILDEKGSDLVVW